MLALITTDIGEDQQSSAEDKRVARRSKLFMRANLRVRGLDLEYALTIKDISSTGLRAASSVSLSHGTRVEIDLPNIGWTAGEIVWQNNGAIGIRFAAIIQPERTLKKVTGTYGSAPSSLFPQLRLV